MADTLGGTYNTGLATVTNGSTAVSIPGALLTTQAIPGDWIYVPVSNYLGFIESVTDDEHLVLGFNWQGGNHTGVPYLLIKMSWSRYDPALTQQKIRELLTFYEGIGFFYFVIGEEPDPGVGMDGQFALKVNSGPWKIWYHTGGAWALQGSPAGIQPQGPYNPVTTYVANDVVSWQGSLYSSRVINNTGHQPDLSPTQWLLLISNGDRYDVTYWDTDRPTSGELVLKCYPAGVTFAVGVSQSYANAEIAATASAVFTYKKNGVAFATITFAAASAIGIFSCPAETAFAHGDILTQFAPPSRDTTLSGIASNLIGFRG